MTQRERVLRALTEAGTAGVSAHQLVYEMGITRGAAIIFELREAGANIETVEEGTLPDGRRKLARYILHSDAQRPKSTLPPPPTAPGWEPKEPRPAMPLALPCGCVRSADGRGWDSRCQKHATPVPA